MKTCRIHITGASGAGVTTLGRAMADALAIPHHDTDDYFWKPTDPPFRHRREKADRLRLMQQMFLGRAGWVLSGSLDGWGDPLIAQFDLVVFVHTAQPIRLDRLRAREAKRFTADAVAPGGWRHQETEEFIEWASQYDGGGLDRRSFEKHQAWLAGLPCPVLRLDGARALPDLVSGVMAAITTAE
jgi:adenylate kinase family enzyme